MSTTRLKIEEEVSLWESLKTAWSNYQDYLKNASGWVIVVDHLEALAQLANIGILVQIAAIWFPHITILVILAALAPNGVDPLIYFCRALIRSTRLVGKHVDPSLKFPEDEHGLDAHPYQVYGDLLSLGLFAGSVLMFSGLVVLGPLAITLGWTLGLAGLFPVAYFDYIYPEGKFKEVYQQAQQEGDADKIALTRKNYLKIKKSRELFLKLLFGLSMLLICGSLIPFVPHSVGVVLDGVSRLASLGLTYIALSRFYNWATSSSAAKRQTLVADPNLPAGITHAERMTSPVSRLLPDSTLGPISSTVSPVKEPTLKYFYLRMSPTKNNGEVKLKNLAFTTEPSSADSLSTPLISHPSSASNSSPADVGMFSRFLEGVTDAKNWVSNKYTQTFRN